MLRLDDLARIFGGRVHARGGRRWLDTSVGGLRAFVICDDGHGPHAHVELAVFTPASRELDPFLAREPGDEWRLGDGLALPRLDAGFVFTGCRRGIVFAKHASAIAPSLDDVVRTFWTLAALAREPWNLPTRTADADPWTQERARARRETWIRLGWVLLVIAIVLWLRSPTPLALAAVLTLLGRAPHGLGDAPA